MREFPFPLCPKETPQFYFSGFAGEAGNGIEDQIQAIKVLGFKAIDLRLVDGEFIHDLPLEICQKIANRLSQEGIRVSSFGSAIGAGKSEISDDPSIAIEQAQRCAERAPIFDFPYIRVMSWIPPRNPLPRYVDEPTAEERFRQLRKIVSILRDGGLEPLHENCNNYGGQSYAHTLRLLEEVPGLSLAFDTANPIGTPDWSFPDPRPMQSTWQFWVAVRNHVKQIHIKDGCYHYDLKKRHLCLPGRGEGDVAAVLVDAVRRGFDGPVSLEPHLGGETPEERLGNFIQAGDALISLSKMVLR